MVAQPEPAIPLGTLAGDVGGGGEGLEQQQSGYSRTYNYYDIYGPSNMKGSGGKKDDEFRVDENGIAEYRVHLRLNFDMAPFTETHW